jgi:hypothetical protein
MIFLEIEKFEVMKVELFGKGFLELRCHMPPYKTGPGNISPLSMNRRLQHKM